MHTEGLAVEPAALRELLRVDADAWRDETVRIEDHYATFGDRLPEPLRDQLRALEKRLAG